MELEVIIIPTKRRRLQMFEKNEATGNTAKAMDYTERTCIIVVEIEIESGTVQIGIVVDSVSEVLSIKGDDVEPPPTFGKKVDTDFILGMAKMEGGGEDSPEYRPGAER